MQESFLYESVKSLHCMQAGQQLSETIAAVLCCPARAAWAPALTTADILYRHHPTDLEATLTAFAQDLASKPMVRVSFLHTLCADDVYFTLMPICRSRKCYHCQSGPIVALCHLCRRVWDVLQS